jgi:prepilin-type N-terminal cleavage/methylation domain-containing protein
MRNKASKPNEPADLQPPTGLRAGFTLVELLIVMLILSLLILMAATRYRGTRERSYIAALQAELRTLAVQQELYHHEHATYAELESLLAFQSSPGVELEFTFADNRGWAAIARHAALSGYQCAVFAGDDELYVYAEPATAAGTITCGGVKE